MERIAVSVTEAAEMLGIGTKAAYNLSRRQDFPAFKVNGRTLVSVEGLRLWAKEQAGGSATAAGAKGA